MLDLELHCHTRWSGDSLTRLPDLIARCKEVGIQRLAITDHSEIEGALQARALAAALPHATLSVIAGAGHVPTVTRPEEIAEGMARFLDDIYGEAG